MEPLLGRTPQIGGDADQEMIEGRPAELLERLVRNLAQVLLVLLGLRALAAGQLGPAAVRRTADVVLEALDLLSTPNGRPKASRRAARPTRVVDQDAGRHRARQLERLEQTGCARAEYGQPVCPVGREARPGQVVALTLDVLLEALALARETGRPPP